jgi:hypothetical protein
MQGFRPAHRVTRFVFFIAAALFIASGPLSHVARAQSVTVTVPGTANLWLADAPAGTTDGGITGLDTAPAQSPVEVVGLPIYPGAMLTFAASGAVSPNARLVPPDPPDGGFFGGAHSNGTFRGIARVNAPLDALLGVFLGPDSPDLTPAPAKVLDFEFEASRNFATISPLLKQPFFIGDGLNASRRQQTFVAPAGATRLFLGTSDTLGWADNGGSFTVTAFVIPEPGAALALTAVGMLALARRRRG